MEKETADRKVVIPNYFNDGKHLYEDQLGWSELEKDEAKSDDINRVKSCSDPVHKKGSYSANT